MKRRTIMYAFEPGDWVRYAPQPGKQEAPTDVEAGMVVEVVVSITDSGEQLDYYVRWSNCEDPTSHRANELQALDA